jgi:hypothetical protein
VAELHSYLTLQCLLVLFYIFSPLSIKHIGNTPTLGASALNADTGYFTSKAINFIPLEVLNWEARDKYNHSSHYTLKGQTPKEDH